MKIVNPLLFIAVLLTPFLSFAMQKQRERVYVEPYPKTIALVKQAMKEAGLDEKKYTIQAVYDPGEPGGEASTNGIVLNEYPIATPCFKDSFVFNVYHEVGHLVDDAQNKIRKSKLRTSFITMCVTTLGVLPIATLGYVTILSIIIKHNPQLIPYLSKMQTGIGLLAGSTAVSAGHLAGERLGTHVELNVRLQAEKTADIHATQQLLKKEILNPIAAQLLNLKIHSLQGIKCFGHDNPSEYKSLKKYLNEQGYTIHKIKTALFNPKNPQLAILIRKDNDAISSGIAWNFSSDQIEAPCQSFFEKPRIDETLSNKLTLSNKF